MSDQTEFRWREGRHVAGVKAEAAYHELARIRSEHGALTPRAVVDESRPEDAPLHPAFEWDDEVAADEYRLWQSRAIIRAVIEIPPAADRTVSYHAFTYVPAPATDKGVAGFYEHSAVVAREPSLLERAQKAVNDAVIAAYRSAQELHDLASTQANTAAIDAADRVMAGMATAKEALSLIQ